MPRGKTPIAYSLQQVTRDFAGVVGQKVLVLVTDGEEECGGDAIEAAYQLVKSGHDAIVHVVGFALADNATKETMKRIAEATQGRFIDAQSSHELEEALAKSFRIPYRVMDTEGNFKAEGYVDHDAIQVPPGKYRIVVSAPRGTVVFNSVNVTSDAATLLHLDNAPRGKDKTGASSKPSP